MSDLVVLRHPNLPATQTITVAPEAVVHHARSGWQVCDPDTPERSARASKTPAEPVTTDPAAAPDDKSKE